MSKNSSSNQVTKTKKCSTCHNFKKKQDFCRLHDSNPQYEHDTCNRFSARRAKKRQEANPKKRSKLTTDLEIVVLTISTSTFRTNVTDFLQVDNIFEDHDNLELALESSIFDDESTNMIEVHDSSDEYDKKENMLSYCIDEVERFIATQFQNAESLGEPTRFALEIKLDSEILEVIKIDWELETGPINLEKTKNSFAQLIKILILPLKSESRYY
ncbi:6633_t:CDS:1 [Racocetra fulgida]|uniref:6633_t:CDS:1 n=1 Tax=Racocetra fulgida TaxID=60492 RepID=A0A9N9HJ78_9GLOM|nr:6633_t:CDS:1 [Racocetra fulgida]